MSTFSIICSKHKHTKQCLTYLVSTKTNTLFPLVTKDYIYITNVFSVFLLKAEWIRIYITSHIFVIPCVYNWIVWIVCYHCLKRMHYKLSYMFMLWFHTYRLTWENLNLLIWFDHSSACYSFSEMHLLLVVSELYTLISNAGTC